MYDHSREEHYYHQSIVPLAEADKPMLRRVYCHTDGPKTANFQGSAKITIFEDAEVGLGDAFTAREGSSRHALGTSSSDVCGGRDSKV